MKSRKNLEEIFERISKQFTFEDAHLELASDRRKGALIEFAKTFFIPDEPLSKSIGLECDEEVDIALHHLYSDNISVLLVSDVTDEIIAIRASHLSHREDNKQMKEIKNDKLNAIFKFLSQKDNEMNAFDKYGVDVAIRFLMLAVDRRHRNKGIASKIMKAAILFYSEIGLDPVVLKGDGTSNFSKAIYEKFGFETLHELVYEDYKVDNEIVFKDTGIHKSAKVYAKKM